MAGGYSVKHHTHTDATRLAGEVFGKILNREADPAGYAYVLDCLESGRKPVAQIVLEFISSDEFIEKFVLGNVSRAAGLIDKLLLGRASSTGADTHTATVQLLRAGVHGYAEKIIRSDAYVRINGLNKVPGSGH